MAAQLHPPEDQRRQRKAPPIGDGADPGSGDGGRLTRLDVLAGARPLLEQMLRQAAEAIIVCDSTGRLILVNAAARRLARQDPEGTTLDLAFEAWGQAFEEGRPVPIEEYSLSRALRGTTEIGREVRMVHADGTIYDVSISAAPIRDDAGAIVGAIANFSDITGRKRTEQALRESREALRQSRQYLQSILDSLFTFVGVMELDGTLIEANRPALEAANLRPEDVLGKPFEETYWWAHSPEVQARLRRAIERAALGETARYDEVIQVAEGRFVTIDFMLAPMRDAAGCITHLVPSGIDITERQRTESALRDSEERLRLALEAAQAGMWSWDIPDDRLDWTPRCKEIFGLPFDREMSYQVFLETLHPDDRDRVHRAVKRALEERGDYRTEMRSVWPDGSVHWVLALGHGFYDEAGRIVRMSGIAIDITERKQAESALREGEARLRSMIEANPIGVIRADIYGDILDANEAFLRIVGYPREDVEAGRLRWSDITPPEDLPLDAERIAEARERGICSPYEKSYIRKDGTRVPVLVGYTLLGERREDSVAFILDLTARKQAEVALKAALAEQDALLRQKDMLMREVNHRVKNSLQLVSSLLLLQSHHITEPAARRQFAEAHNRVLTVAKVHQRLYQQTKTPDRIEFGQYLRDLCTDLVSASLEQWKGIEVRVEADQDDMLTDQAVPLALIVNELLMNAVKYAFGEGAPAGGKVTVTFRVEADGRRRLTVADDGRGLPEGFDPARSSGLGMRLVSALAGQLGARLEVGKPGNGAESGARFTVVLPAGAA